MVIFCVNYRKLHVIVMITHKIINTKIIFFINYSYTKHNIEIVRE